MCHAHARGGTEISKGRASEQCQIEGSFFFNLDTKARASAACQLRLFRQLKRIKFCSLYASLISASLTDSLSGDGFCDVDRVSLNPKKTNSLFFLSSLLVVLATVSDEA